MSRITQLRDGEVHQTSRGRTDFAFKTFCTNGMQYAAVFPLPVLALARMSLFSNANGMAFVCTSVGLANPRSARARSILASRMCANCVKVALESTSLASGMAHQAAEDGR